MMSLRDIVLQLLITIFGKYWYVFISYMIFNFLDWSTGILKAIKLKEVSSHKGTRGLLNKLGYWVVIGIAFSCSSMFVIIGKEVLNLNLSFMYLLGWFTFLLLIINEITSILENLVQLNVRVPDILMNSLKITGDILDNTSKKMLHTNKGDDCSDSKNK